MMSHLTTTPGQVMDSLKDRRSLSRLETVKTSLQAPADTNHSTKLKNTRELSMPRLPTIPKDKPSDEPLIPQTISRVQQQISLQGGLLYELNVRLSNLSELHGPSFTSPQYKSLRVIDIRNNRIVELPGEVCSLTHITHLKLDYNYLQALPYSIGSIRSLIYVSASQNRLQELPDSLFHKESKLQQLLVNDNKIKVL